jgi:hypothetical protein
MICLDPSVIFSLYAADTNSAEAASLVRSADEPLILTPFCELETLNAFSLGVFRKQLSDSQAWRLRQYLQLDLEADVYQCAHYPQLPSSVPELWLRRSRPRSGYARLTCFTLQPRSS